MCSGGHAVIRESPTREFCTRLPIGRGQVPVIAMDTLFYGKLTVVPWNIVKYNVFPDSQRGPELYGTEPVHFYLFNLLLNFNVLVPFALFSLPALAITYRVDRKPSSPVGEYEEKGI